MVKEWGSWIPLAHGGLGIVIWIAAILAIVWLFKEITKK